MTDKQRRFADEYLIDLNATRAYKAAYPSVKRDETAAAAASRLLSFVKVQEYIKEHMQQRQERVQITQDEVVTALKELAFNAEKDTDRIRALELLGKHLGMFQPHKDELDRQEQDARIAKLRADTRQQETQEERAVIVHFVGTEGSEE